MDIGSDSAGPTVVPAELSAQPPRNVRMTGTGWTNVIAIMVFLGLAVAWAFHVYGKSMPILRVRSALRTGASEAAGQITREWASGRKGNSAHHISYAFQVGGNIYNGDSTVPYAIWKQLKNDSDVKIGYLPTDPAINHPVDWEESTWSIWSPLMVALPPALGGFALFMMLLSQRRLLVEGLSAQARITEFKKGNRGGFIMKYEFRTETGDLVASGCSGVETQEIGSTVRVLYLPNRPHRNQIYPIETFRVDQ
jgi:hypothetical protein